MQKVYKCVLFSYFMVQAVLTLKKIGGSLTVRIPMDIVKQMSLREGQSVSIEVKREPKDYFGAFPGIGPWKKQPNEFYSKYL